MHHDHPRALDEVAAVVVLTGGASRRMGRHKPALEVGGRPMVERVVDAARPRRTLVVGSDLGVPGDTTTVADDRPGGGPVAGLAAGLRHLDHLPSRACEAAPDRIGLSPHAGGSRSSADLVIVLAGDLPFVTSAHLDRLVVALRREDASVAVTTDDDGQRNWLCAAWRLQVLRGRLADLGDPSGQSMRGLAEGMLVTEVDHRGEATDVDTPDELDLARRRAGDAPRRE
ncbi:MAG: molybdenum cofactor guanylyltransferase [Terracoccus sp.]